MILKFILFLKFQGIILNKGACPEKKIKELLCFYKTNPFLKNWQGITPLYTGEDNVTHFYGYQDAVVVNFLIKGNKVNRKPGIYLDTDNNALTGFNVWAWPGSGADYLVEKENVFRYTGTGTDWSWEFIGSAEYYNDGNILEIAVDQSLIGNPVIAPMAVGFIRNSRDFAPAEGSPMALLNP